MDVHSNHTLERTVVIRTPENLEVSYSLAGAGTRAAAYFIDLVLMFAIMTIFQNLFVAVILPFGESLQTYILAVLAVFSFAYFNAYFMTFELLWAGQSPGKRMVGIRVVKTGGFSLQFSDSLIRNLLRAVDFIPLFYGVGLLSLLFTRQCQRIGDLVAGTLVVYQEEISSKDLIAQAATSVSSRSLSVVKLGMIPADVIETCDEFLRTKDQLAPRYRQQFASDLVELVNKLSGLSPDAAQSDESFLLNVVSQFGQIPAMS